MRSFIADEIELFAASFFQLPMLRKLEADMQTIALDPDSQAEAENRKNALDKKIDDLKNTIEVVDDCVKCIKTFRACCV